jgi:hypothetical protein
MIAVKPPFGDIGVSALRHALRAAAMLDAIVEADTAYRYFRYKHNWLPDADLGQIDDGCGNNVAAVFLDSAALIKGFDHESELSPFPRGRDSVWPGIYDEVPHRFTEPLAKINPGERVPLDTTFCIWRTESDNSWKRSAITVPVGCDDGGFEDLLGLIPVDASGYESWAQEYYERTLPSKAIAAVYEGAPINAAILQAFNAPERIVQVRADAAAADWPIQ